MKVLIFFVLIFTLSSFVIGAESGRFFYEGDGVVSLLHNQSGRRDTIQYRLADGSYPREAQKKMDRLFGIPSVNLGEGISLRLIAMLDYLEDRYAKGKTLRIKSGYRSPKYNEGLRKKGRLAAQTSYHVYGMAADVIFPGASHKEIWEYVRHLDCCGIGHYGGNAVHVDSGKPRFWTAATALPKKKEPQENKNIYLAPEFDIYRPGETIRLFFSGISVYPFGVKPTFKLVKGKKTVERFKPEFKYKENSENSTCVKMEKLKDVRFIYWKIPEKIQRSSPLGKKSSAKLEVEVEFCDPTYSKMPKKIVSKPFMIKSK